MSKKNGKNGGDELSNRWVDLSKLYDLKAYDMNEEDRLKVLKELSHKVEDAKPGALGEHESITLLQEIGASVFLLIFVGSMLWIPFAAISFFITVRSWQIYMVRTVKVLDFWNFPRNVLKWHLFFSEGRWSNLAYSCLSSRREVTRFRSFQVSVIGFFLVSF